MIKSKPQHIHISSMYRWYSCCQQNGLFWGMGRRNMLSILYRRLDTDVNGKYACNTLAVQEIDCIFISDNQLKWHAFLLKSVVAYKGSRITNRHLPRETIRNQSQSYALQNGRYLNIHPAIERQDFKFNRQPILRPQGANQPITEQVHGLKMCNKLGCRRRSFPGNF